MSDDQFTRLFRYMTERFDKIERELAKKADAEKLERVLTTLDGIIARLDTDEAERAALTHQVNRHEARIEQLAKKSDLALKS